MILQLKVITITKNRFIPRCDLFCLFVVIRSKLFTDFATRTGTKGYDTFVILLKELMINTRLVIHTLKISF
ncbi:hypothetical protein D3C73_981990 [compost metagenome]